MDEIINAIIFAHEKHTATEMGKEIMSNSKGIRILAKCSTKEELLAEIKDEDDASPTYSGGGVAALRARFHGSNAAAPWNNAPPATGPKSPLILRSHAQSDTSSSPAIPRSPST